MRLNEASRSFPHPPYSPDLASSDFYLFPNLKTNLRGRNFGSNEGVIDAVDEYLGDQEDAFYFEEISKLEQRWRNCIEAKGNYVEEYGKLLSWSVPKYRVRERFDRPSYYGGTWEMYITYTCYCHVGKAFRLLQMHSEDLTRQYCAGTYVALRFHWPHISQAILCRVMANKYLYGISIMLTS